MVVEVVLGGVVLGPNGVFEVVLGGVVLAWLLPAARPRRGPRVTARSGEGSRARASATGLVAASAAEGARASRPTEQARRIVCATNMLFGSV